jgi:hypothetical protein
MNKYLPTLFLLFFNIPFSDAQNPPSLQSFKIERFRDEILIVWEISSGNLCSGLKIEHSIDSLNFLGIFDYPGICGNSSVSERYSFSHMHPVANSLNFYRIDLNTNGTSETLKVFYADLKEKNYSLFPNPVSTSTNLYFNNPDNETVTFRIYNLNGKEFINQSNIRTGIIPIGSFKLPSGIYHFSIDKGKEIINGKFVI